MGLHATPEMWNRLIDLLRQGMFINHACDQPGTPHKVSVTNRMKRDPAFRDLIHQIYAERGDLHFVGKRAGPGRPAEWGPFFEKLATGMLPALICRLPGMPARSSFTAKVKRDAQFRLRVLACWIPGRKPPPRYKARKVTDRARHNVNLGLAPVKELRLELGRNPLYAAAFAASLPPRTRDDVISEIVLAVLTGEIEMGDVAKEAPRFLRAHYRERPTKFGPSSDFVIA